MKNLNLQAAAEVSRSLGQGCAPATTEEFSSVEELFAAMEVAAEADNARSAEGFRWAKPWSWTDHGSLTYTTGSRRMVVEVGEGFIWFGLFSPAYEAGELPFCVVMAQEGKVLQAEIPPGARKIIYEKPDRLSHLGQYICPVLGEDNVLAGAGPETARFLCQLWIKNMKASLTFMSEEGTFGEEILAEARERIASYEAKLQNI